MNENILKRYFANKYSRNDYFKVKSVFHQKGNNPDLEKQMNDLWIDFDADELPELDFDHILDKLQHQIYLNENRKGKKRHVSFWQNVQRIAAILFLPLLIGSLLYHSFNKENSLSENSWAEIQCPLGVRTKFQLPDGSTGFLNSGSALKYPVSFADNRTVILTGEGFFDVMHNEKFPFHVKTKNLDVRVLGTSFNVIAYNDEKSEEIVLQTGHIDVSDHTGRKIISLVPDERLVFDKETHEYEMGKVVSEQYTTWKAGKLMFRNERIDDVVIRLERWYNAEILIDKSDPRIFKYTFHGTFVDEQLEDVLNVLTIAAPISYHELSRKTDNDGIYLKHKFILSINPDKIEKFK